MRTIINKFQLPCLPGRKVHRWSPPRRIYLTGIKQICLSCGARRVPCYTRKTSILWGSYRRTILNIASTRGQITRLDLPFTTKQSIHNLDACVDAGLLVKVRPGKLLGDGKSRPAVYRLAK